MVSYTHMWLTQALIIRIDIGSSWNVVAHGDAREGKWRGNWWMEWVASTLHTTSEHGVSSITTADAHTSAASSRLNWRPADLNGLIHFAEIRNLVSARVPSHFNWPLPPISTWLHLLASTYVRNKEFLELYLRFSCGFVIKHKDKFILSIKIIAPFQFQCRSDNFIDRVT